jgi:hypothetical protein
MDLQEMVWAGMEWIDLVHNTDQQWALVKVVMNHQVL